MPTKDCGGQGAPFDQQGAFVLEYRYCNRKGHWASKKLMFSEYSEAITKYESLDTTASLWDTTGRPELCAAKARVAYYSLWSHERSRENVRRMLAVAASEPGLAVTVVETHLKGAPWVVFPETVAEITEQEYKMLQTNNPWPA